MVQNRAKHQVYNEKQKFFYGNNFLRIISKRYSVLNSSTIFLETLIFILQSTSQSVQGKESFLVMERLFFSKANKQFQLKKRDPCDLSDVHLARRFNCQAVIKVNQFHLSDALLVHISRNPT